MRSTLLYTALLLLARLAVAIPAVVSGQEGLEDLEGRSTVEERSPSTEAGAQFQPFNLTDICLDCHRAPNATLYNCTLEFDWADYNSVADNNVSSCVCQSNWTWDGVSTTSSQTNNTFSTAYSICVQEDDTYFEMKFVYFAGPSNFTLEIAHHYLDDQDFAAPWDYPTTWAEPQLSLQKVNVRPDRMRYYDAGPIYAQVIGASD